MRAVSAAAVIYAKDLPRMTGFYAAVTGLPVTGAGLGYRAFGDDLVLQAIPEEIGAAVTIGEPPVRREAAAVKPVFTVVEIAAARAAAAASGGVIDPAERQWQFNRWTVCDGHDPEGNVIQLRAIS